MATMVKHLVVFFLTIMSAHSQQSKGTKTNARIVEGSIAPEGRYPYQVSLRYRGNHICGGSIVDHQWIVTAAHCVAGLPTSSLKVVVGTNKLRSGGFKYNVTEVNIHEGYNSWILKNDVAMLKVKPMTYAENVGPVVLDGEPVGGNELCTLSGWGMLVFPGPAPNNLQHINLTTTTVAACRGVMHPISPDQICTFTKAEEGACRYDSGGPLVRTVNGTTKQIGVVSWGLLCALGYPDVYSRVSSYLAWFRETCKCI